MSNMALLEELDAALSEPVRQLLAQSGARQAPHSGRTLHEHLGGTWLLLKRWGNPGPVCLAGLFHSIYGTNVFARQSLQARDRPRLQAAIGAQAEGLAWLFCKIDRPRAILQGLQTLQAPRTSQPGRADLLLAARRDQGETAPLPATPEQLRALAEIECANLIEQGSWSAPLRELYCVAIEQPVLSEAALAALRSGWSQQLVQSSAAAPNPLKQKAAA